MIKVNNVNKFLRGCSDHGGQLLYLFELKSFPGLTDGVSSWKDVFAITCNLLKRREKSRAQGAIGFGFASHWLKNWREIF